MSSFRHFSFWFLTPLVNLKKRGKISFSSPGKFSSECLEEIPGARDLGSKLHEGSRLGGRSRVSNKDLRPPDVLCNSFEESSDPREKRCS
ncbi:hypothetical protein K0M31_007626 [Melipona bicolor]|uniref:Uncharacterized protein n=1 Tax=Melipona bicolor TaxID=60889 RepID=A0AA40GBR8_9HYME|nr:hypothetical protein K0M31_007626 [Melipona bicolor]